MTGPTRTTTRAELYRCGIDELRHREIGALSPPAFAHRIGGCEDLIKRLKVYAELDGHQGCVNTVHFNPSGDILVSGSDDMDIVFWDWAARRKRFSFASGHENNVFQARVMPFTDDCSVVTCAADGQVRHAEISPCGKVKTMRLAKHRGRAHKLAVEPGSPRTFFSCGEDGVVRHFDLREGKNSVLLICQGRSRRSSSIVHLNTININPRRPHLFAVGGSDEYARVYDLRKVNMEKPRNSEPVDLFAPKHLVNTKEVHITCIAYSPQEEMLVSYNDELIYMFDSGPTIRRSVIDELVDQGIGQGQQEGYQVYKGHRNAQTVKGVNFFGPNSEYVVSGSDCGHIFIWKKRGGELVSLMKGDIRVVNCLEPHPSITALATSGIDKTVKVWTPTASKIQPLPANVEEIMEKNRMRRQERSQISLSILRLLIPRRDIASSRGRWSSEMDQDEDEDEDEDEDGDDIW